MKLSPDPIAQIETGAHSDFIKKISVSLDGRLVLSVSDDKTARLWEGASGRLLHILRIPLNDDFEGQLYAGALSPDGRTAAIGGFTGLTFGTGQAIVYFFDTASGALTSRLDGLAPAAVENIAFSPDGRFMAICQADGAGAYLFDLHDRGLLRRDTDPGDKILGASFSVTGDFAMTTLDGRLWVYEAASDFKVRHVLQLQTGRRPMHVQYSPGGELLVVGYDDVPAFDVFDSGGLASLHTTRLPAEYSQAGLHVVEWSGDGESVFAGGETIDGEHSPIYRFEGRGRGPPQVVLNAKRRISEIRRMPGGAMAFSSGEPEVGVFEADSTPRWRKSPVTVDLGGARSDLIVSANGKLIEFVSGSDGLRYRFEVTEPERAFRQVADPDPLLVGAREQAEGWDIQPGAGDGSLLVNGHPVDLDHRERVLRWAFLLTSDRLAIGTRWSIRLVDGAGRLIWRAPMVSEVHQLAPTPDGSMIVAAVSDGTIRWFRSSDGQPLLALMPHRNGADWVAWIPDGYYMSSLEGDSLIGWHLNNGIDHIPDFYRAVQFERVFYRPDLVRRHMDDLGHSSVRRAHAPGDQLNIADLRAIAPPDLSIRVRDVSLRDDQPLAVVEISAFSRGLPIEDWSLYVNGVPVTPTGDRMLAGEEARGFTRLQRIPLTAAANEVRLEAFNGKSLGATQVLVETALSSEPRMGRLLVVAVGIGEYADPGIPRLRYAPRDAIEFAGALQQSADGLFTAVESLVISDLGRIRGRRDNIRQLSEFVASATGDDTVVVFLAAHGISDPAGNYFLIPADATMEDVEQALSGMGGSDALIEWTFLFDALRRTAGRRVLIVDTCHAADVIGPIDGYFLAKRSMSSSIAFVTAARGNEKSQENSVVRHGIFTYGLIEAIREGRDLDGDGRVDLSEAFVHAVRQVERLRVAQFGPQTPQLTAPDFLERVPLAAVR